MFLFNGRGNKTKNEPHVSISEEDEKKKNDMLL